MNSTSFTSIEESSDDFSRDRNIDLSDKMEGIEAAYSILNSSSRQQQLQGKQQAQATRSNRSSNNSDSDPDRSPSVTVLTTSSSGNHLHHHHHHHHHHNNLLTGNHRASQLITGGFSLSNRLHLTKHQRNLWSRATNLEKLLLITVLILALATILLFTSLISVLISQKQVEIERQQNGAGEDGTVSTSFSNNKTVIDHNGKNYCVTPQCVKVAASVIEAIDLTVDPCDDFYMYSCGDWIKSNPLPDGKSNWGTFSKLWQDNQSIMRSVLEGANFTRGSAEEKAKIYYESCLDRNDTVESRGPTPMQDLIESAGGWNISGYFDLKSWDLQSSLQIYHNQYNRGGLFSWAVGADERNSTRNIIQLDQGGLGLPSRDYYLNHNKTDKNVLFAYYIYMVKIGELMAGVNETNSSKILIQQMEDVLDFEKRLAEITVPQDQRRDDERMYHKFTLKELTKRSPFLNWTKYFNDAFDYHSRTTISFSSEIKPPNRNHQQATTATANLSTNESGNNSSFKLASSNNQQLLETNSNDSTINANNNNNNNNNNNDKFKNQTKYSLSVGNPTLESNNAQLQKQSTSTISKHRITEDESVVIYSPEYFEELSNLIKEYSSTDRGKVTLANYMAWSVIQSLIATLPKNFRDASKILRRVLIGSEGIEVSWRYCVTDTNQVMGFALGSLFVRRVFQGNSKERAEEMIYSIRNAFKDNLPNLAWMDDRTRMLAKEKADHINQMIGFPDFILSPEKLNGKYEGLELDENNYFENNIKVNVLSLRENMEKINKPANKTEWEMTPPMVNAYYTPTKNQIVFPAGILQTPFYDLSYPNSLNYGAMGVVMGHELTHAFDDQGREYDKDGNLYQWWYNETLKNFEDRVKCFVDQYSSYKIDEILLNGKQTLGENIADNGGLKAAFRAYERWAEVNTEPRLPGLNLTGKQLFFVGFSQVWCSISTPEALKLQVLNDPHAPAQFRVIGTLSNSQEFAREFNCPVGSNMNPEKKCVVW